MPRLFSLWLVLSILGTGSEEPLDSSRLEALVEQHASSSFALLRELLSLPNDAHFEDHVKANVEWMEGAFRSRNFDTWRLETGGPPLLLAVKQAPRAERTVLVYLQIDGQPVDHAKWFQKNPYEPVLKERRGDQWRQIPWQRLQDQFDPELRVFARSASDAKGPVAMFLTALDILESEDLEQTSNLKIIMDFEEELGSPHLPAAVSKYRRELAADMMLIFDGPRHITNQPTLTFGARGIATLTLTVYGPRTPQHSGHFGNYLPNPAVRLVRLLASMKDAEGRVTIPGYYDGVELDQATRRVLRQTPDDEAAIRRRLGVAAADAVAPTLQEALQYPSMNIRGLSSGWVGEQVRTVIPATATAEIDVRLVPEVEAERLIGLIRQHIEDQGYHLIADREPTEAERSRQPRIASLTHEVSYQAFRTPYDSAVGVWLTKALRRAFGQDPIRIRMSGGSIPISPFVTELGIPAVTVPTVNRDNNQHSPNENLRLGNYLQGIATFLAILTEE